MGSDAGCQKSSALPPFLVKTYDMVDDPVTDHIVSWSSAGSSFVVWNSTDFCRDLLPQYFKHNNLSSFVRQLNTYGFRKICPDQWEFATEGFVKGQKEALKNIHRRKSLPSSNLGSRAHDNCGEQQPESPKCSILAHQELEGEVKKLHQDKKLLIDQLSKVQLEQKTMETSLVDLGKRLKSLEERQQQILSFMARVANPAFWAQSVQNPSESNMLLLFNKKRRLLAGDGPLDHQEACVGRGDSGESKEKIVSTLAAEMEAWRKWGTKSEMTPLADVPSEGILQQFSSGLPQCQILGSSPISLGSGLLLREVQMPANCGDNEEALIRARKNEQCVVEAGDFANDDGICTAQKTSVDKHAQGTSGSDPRCVVNADIPGEGICRQPSLCLSSNQSLGASPTWLSYGGTLTEAHKTSECEESPLDHTSDPASDGQDKNTLGNLVAPQKPGNGRTALGLYLPHKPVYPRSSIQKSSKKKGKKQAAKVSGSNDGFWEKYLTESPSSTDSGSDSETEHSAGPRERQFL